MVAVRPLRVEELAELLAFEFDAAQGVIPKYRLAWRLDDQTRAVLSTCSSLIIIVDHSWYGRIVQFSHFSVKEFLMSNRLTSCLGDFSRYHIRPGPAHTILTQACLGSLLHLDDLIDKESVKGFPLAAYAAPHWVEHAQFEDVASRVKDGMETLFDCDKPHFATWIGIFDIDTPMASELGPSDAEIPPKPIPNPLYYSALCGFYDLVGHLAIKHPEHVNVICGNHRFPLLAALSQDHVEVAELLLEHGANVDIRESTGETILFKVLSWPPDNLVNIVKFLLKHGTDVNARDDTLRSSLHLAEYRGELKVAEMLVKHKADVNSQDNNGKTPLHILSERWVYDGDGDGDDVLNHVQLLLEHGAEMDRRDKDNQTPLLLLMWGARFKFMRILLEHGADANGENNNGKTPLHILSERQMYNGLEDDVLDHARLLLGHGAEVNRRDKNNQTPLLLAMVRGRFKLAQILLEDGANANVESRDGKTPLHLLAEDHSYSKNNVLNLALLLLEHGAELNKRDKDDQTPLLMAMGRDWFKLVRILLERGADASGENKSGKTSLHLLSESRIHGEGDALDLIWLLLEHGAEVNRRDKNDQTPLQLAMERDWFKLAQILLEHGADANVGNNNGGTPLHILSKRQIFDPSDIDDVFNNVRLCSEHRAEVNKRYKGSEIPLLLEIGTGTYKFVWNLLSFSNADASVENKTSETSVRQVSRGQYGSQERGVGVAQLLLECGVDINAQDENHTTPSHLQSNFGPVQIAQALLDHGADVNAGNKEGETSLLESEHHTQCDSLGITQFLTRAWRRGGRTN